MLISKNRFLAILSAFLILMAVTTCIVSAQETDESSSDDSASDSGSTDDSGSDSVDDSGSGDSSADDSSEDTSSDDSADDTTEEESTDSSGAVEDTTDDSSDEEPAPDESGAIVNEEDSVDDIEDTTDEEPVIESGTIFNEDDSAVDYPGGSKEGVPTVAISDDDTTIIDTTTSISDDDTTITDDDTINANNSTVIKDVFIDDSDTNITEITDIDIDNSNDTTISFEDNSVVNNINFVSKESGKTKVIVKEVYEKPPVENVYKTFNIFVDNAEVATNMENAAVDFKVEKTWLIENNLDASVIVLNMYEGDKWIEVPVTITGEDSQYVYFKAKVSKYSTFAISSKAITVDKVMKQTNNSLPVSQDDSIENMDGPTKSVIVKMLEFVIELIEGS